MNHPCEDWEPGFQDDPHAVRNPLEPPMPDDDESAPPDEPPAFAAMRRIEYTGRLHHMTFRALLSGDGLPPAQATAIKFIIQNPGMIQRELSDKLHIQRATTTVMLQKMERAGLILRRQDPDDQRIYRIYPTEIAVAIEDENHKRVDQYFGACFSDFTDEDFQQLSGLLTRLIANIRSAGCGAYTEEPAQH